MQRGTGPSLTITDTLSWRVYGGVDRRTRRLQKRWYQIMHTRH